MDRQPFLAIQPEQLFVDQDYSFAFQKDVPTLIGKLAAFARKVAR